MPTVCDILIERLHEAGVRHIFGVPGDAINSLLEAIRLQEHIKFIHVNHEETGAFVASAQAKLTGSLAVCAGTAGPGAIHLLNGLYDAKCDHAPVLAITGQVETQFLGSGYQQEVDLCALFQDVAAYNQMIVNPEHAPYVISQAIRTAIEYKTVVHLNIPVDVAGADVSERKAWPLHLPMGLRHKAEPHAIAKAAALLNESERIAILAGIGCQDASEKVLAVAERLQAPVIHALRAKELFPESHPLSVGGIGHLGVMPSINALKEADLVFLIGTDFPYFDYLPEKTKAIQIDIDPKQIGKRMPVEIGLVGDAACTLTELLPLLKDKKQNGYLRGIQDAAQKWEKQVEKDIELTARPIKPQRLAHMIGKHADKSAIFVCDTGEVTAWCARYLPIQPGQRFAVSGMLASMAFALPAAIGAKLAYPERQVIALAGDGGFSMLMTDFLTAVKYKLPLTIVVFNNHRLGMIRIEQEAKGYPDYETEMCNPDFAAFARLCGGNGVRLTDPNQLESVLQEAYGSPVPFVIDVEIDPDEIPVPAHVTPGQAVNFGIAKVREFLNVRN